MYLDTLLHSKLLGPQKATLTIILLMKQHNAV